MPTITGKSGPEKWLPLGASECVANGPRRAAAPLARSRLLLMGARLPTVQNAGNRPASWRARSPRAYHESEQPTLSPPPDYWLVAVPAASVSSVRG